jgi:hypothetical protein
MPTAPFRFMVPMHAKKRKEAFHEPDWKKASSPQPSPPEEEREKTQVAGSRAQCSKLFSRRSNLTLIFGKAGPRGNFVEVILYPPGELGAGFDVHIDKRLY